MQVKFNKDSKEWLMFTEYWSLCQRYWVPESDSSYWQGLLEDVRAFGDKHNFQFAKRLSKCLVDDLEERYKNEV